MPIEGWTDEDQEELEETKRQMKEEEEARKTRKSKRVVQHVKFFDAFMCFQRGQWNDIDDDLRRRYIMILRRAANANTFSTDEVRKNALAVLEAVNVPAVSEKRLRALRKQPLTEKEKENVAKSRRKLVDRQKRLLVEKIKANELTQMAAIVDPGPYQIQAFEELSREGKIVVIEDEEIPITKGRAPYDGSPRRNRRVVRLGLPLDTNAPVEPAQAPQPATETDEDLI